VGAGGRREREGEREERTSFPSPIPLFPLFGSRPIFRAGRAPRVPILCLALLPDPTEALATQADSECSVVFKVTGRIVSM